MLTNEQNYRSAKGLHFSNMHRETFKPSLCLSLVALAFSRIVKGQLYAIYF